IAARNARRNFDSPQFPGRGRIPVQVLAPESELRTGVWRIGQGRATRDEPQRGTGSAARSEARTLLLHRSRPDIDHFDAARGSPSGKGGPANNHRYLYQENVR